MPRSGERQCRSHPEGFAAAAAVLLPRVAELEAFVQTLTNEIQLGAVEVGQALVPVVGVFLHHPDFVLDAALALERSGAWNVGDATQVALVIVQRLLADDAVPARSEGRHHEARGSGLAELEDHRLLVGRLDFTHRREQSRARDHHALWRLADAVIGGLHVRRGEVRAVMELHALAQVEGVGLAVLRDLPAVRQVRDDRLARIARIAPHQIVVHAALAAEAVDRARLVEVEVRQARSDGVFQHAARFWVGLGCLELEFGAVEFVGHALGERPPWHIFLHCIGENLVINICHVSDKRNSITVTLFKPTSQQIKIDGTSNMANVRR